MTSKTKTSWQLKGTLLQACNCDYGCPCNFNAPPTRGDCEGMWAWHVDEGRYGDVPMGGLNFSVAADWPGAIHEGKGEAVILVDERANPAQRKAISALLSGNAGGPWAIIATTLSKVHGPRYVPFQMELKGAGSTLRAGDAMHLEMEPIRNPVTGAEVFPRVVLPQGFVYKESTRASSKSFRVNDGVHYEYKGRDAAFAPFEYTGP